MIGIEVAGAVGGIAAGAVGLVGALFANRHGQLDSCWTGRRADETLYLYDSRNVVTLLRGR